MPDRNRNPMTGQYADRDAQGPVRFYVLDEGDDNRRPDLYQYGHSDPRLRPGGLPPPPRRGRPRNPDSPYRPSRAKPRTTPAD